MERVKVLLRLVQRSRSRWYEMSSHKPILMPKMSGFLRLMEREPGLETQ